MQAGRLPRRAQGILCQVTGIPGPACRAAVLAAAFTRAAAAPPRMQVALPHTCQAAQDSPSPTLYRSKTHQVGCAGNGTHVSTCHVNTCHVMKLAFPGKALRKAALRLHRANHSFAPCLALCSVRKRRFVPWNPGCGSLR